jgi:hypothetical protein
VGRVFKKHRKNQKIAISITRKNMNQPNDHTGKNTTTSAISITRKKKKTVFNVAE